MLLFHYIIYYFVEKLNSTSYIDSGDVCKDDWDGDGVPDEIDASEKNYKITATDFRRIQDVHLGTKNKIEATPVWVVSKRVRNCVCVQPLNHL